MDEARDTGEETFLSKQDDVINFNIIRIADGLVQR